MVADGDEDAVARSLFYLGKGVSRNGFSSPTTKYPRISGGSRTEMFYDEI